jgi:hypothetical protein
MIWIILIVVILLIVAISPWLFRFLKKVIKTYKRKGVYTFPDGRKYVGEWEYDLPNGLVTFKSVYIVAN